MTLPELKRKVKYWRSLLHIDSQWTITVKWGTEQEVEGCAAINILEPEYQLSTIYMNKVRHEEEHEETLLHELLHIVYDGHKPQDLESDPYDPVHELAINKTSKLLIELDRAAQQVKAMNVKDSSTGHYVHAVEAASGATKD